MKVNALSFLFRTLTLILPLCSIEAFSQTPVEIIPTPPCTIPIAEKDKLEIQQITLTDQELIKQIGVMIGEKQADSVFRRRGYISVSYVNRAYPNEQVVRAYNIAPEYLSADEMTNEYRFPLFYSYMNNKLVTIRNTPIYESICYQIKTKSKKAFQKILEPYLEKKIRIDMPNSSGTGTVKVKLREDFIQIHGGKTLYILADGRSIVEQNK